MQIIINKYQIQLTYKLLTNKNISNTFINKNQLIILNNPTKLQILPLLKRNYITYKIIK
jgi:hypothetical protein